MAVRCNVQSELVYQMKGAIEDFRAITNDYEISKEEVSKFINWGSGNLEHAINYYYRAKDKQAKSQRVQSNGVTAVAKEEGSRDAFQCIKQATAKQQRTERYINRIREEYKLPIKGRANPSQGSKQQKVIDADSDMDAEFAEADYLPEVFNQKEISFQSNQADRSREVEVQIGRESSIQQLQPRPQQQPSDWMEDKKKNGLKEISWNNQDTTRLSQPTRVNQPKFQYVSDPSEYFLGEVILGAFAIKFQNNLQLPQGERLEYRYYIQQQKKKKGSKFNSKNVQKNMNIRLTTAVNGEFGRLKDEQVRIFLPLIVHGMLRMELYSLSIPRRTDYYTQMKVKARVFLLKKAVTDPVVETFQGHSDLIVSVYKTVAEELLSLFDRLQLPIKTWPLIKRKSKHKTKQETIIQKRQDKNMRELDDEQRKIKQREVRQRTDPMFKTIQKNITDMFKTTAKQTSPQATNQKPQEKSAVKKRILQLKTIEEDKCAQLIDLYEEDLEPYTPSAKFTSQLYDYQSRALTWMMRREGHQDKKHRESEELHPLWTEFQLPQGERIFLNELTSQVSTKPPMSKTKCLGGILADEMGLGKTVMMAALMATAVEDKKSKKKGGKNLVVVPLTLLSQWESQIKRHTKNTKTLIYYGTERKENVENLANYDVIITTYGTVSFQFSKGFHVSKNGIYKLHWQRIILDEAHNIKGRIIQTAKAVYELQGMYRWCLTGTPIQNNLTDLFSLVHFIRYTPWSEYQCWNKYINKPVEQSDQNVYEVLRTILKRVFLRRTKQSKDQFGNPIITLPAKLSRVELLQMDEKQRQFYDSIYQSSKSTIQELQRQGILQTKYMQVLEILMRLRQICCHPILYRSATKFVSDTSQFQGELRKFIRKREVTEEGQSYFQPIFQGNDEYVVEVSEGKGASEKFIKETLSKIENGQVENCPVCLSDVQEPVITTCLHIFCRTCAIRQIEQCGICSVCRKRLSRQDFMFLPRENRFNVCLNDKSKYFRSTKLQALIERLTKLQPEDKVVIFSQFLGMLDLIEHDLKQQKITYVRMQGSTSHKERTRIVQSFQKDPKVQIFIASLKTGGVGLNLVAANKVFLMDPWWNPGVEDQAIERVHRIGQKRQVQVVRFIMQRSIQMRMMQLNTNKKQLSQKVLSQQNSHGQKKVEMLRYLMQKY